MSENYQVYDMIYAGALIPLATGFFVCCLFAVLGLELRVSTLSHSTSLIFGKKFF
jgi:hypothetical protein